MFHQRIIDFPPLGNRWAYGLASAELLSAADVRNLTEFVSADVRPDDFPEPVHRWCNALALANSEYFRFDLEGALELDEPRLVEFGAAELSTDLGLGLTPEHSTRKLVSLVVLDVPEVGAELVLQESGRSVAAAVGHFVTFPAYATVRCVTTGPGIRVLTAHGIGPAFR
jgi:hypothetical protein